MDEHDWKEDLLNEMNAQEREYTKEAVRRAFDDDPDETPKEGAKIVQEAMGRTREMRLSIAADEMRSLALDQWEAGFHTAVSIVEKSGGVDMAEYLKQSLEAYWRSQGVEDEL